MPGGPTRRHLLVAVPTALFAAGCIGSLTGEQDPEERVVSLYAKGVDSSQNGSRHLEDGLRAHENEEWVFVESDSGTARELFSRAVDQFGGAAERAGELGNQGAQDVCDEAARKATVLRSAASHLAKAGRARQDGDDKRAEERYERAQAALDRADQYRIRDVAVLEAEFGDN